MASEEEIDEGIDQTALMALAKAKAKKNLKKGEKEAKKKFLEKYPYADTSKFEFITLLDENGDIDKYEVYYKDSDISGYDITSSTFLNNKELTKYLYWQKPWGTSDTVQSFVKNTTDLSVNNFKIYVTNDLFFNVNLPKLEIKNNETSYDYNENSFERRPRMSAALE